MKKSPPKCSRKRDACSFSFTLASRITSEPFSLSHFVANLFAAFVVILFPPSFLENSNNMGGLLTHAQKSNKLQLTQKKGREQCPTPQRKWNGHSCFYDRL